VMDDHVRFRLARVAGRCVEQTYRTRSFVFFAVAAMVCKLVGGRGVWLGETGQGSIGSALTPGRGGFFFQSLHPAFTTRLSRFLKFIWGGVSVPICHPHLWYTKAQLLTEIDKMAGNVEWQLTQSCSRANGAMRRKGGKLPRHCGMCANCLLRRLALIKSGNRKLHDDEAYWWGDLAARSPSEAVKKWSLKITKNDEEIFLAAVLAHTHLARFAERPEEAEAAIRRCAFDLCEVDTSVSRMDMEERIKGLLECHRSEWSSFLGELPRESWVRQMAGGA